MAASALRTKTRQPAGGPIVLLVEDDEVVRAVLAAAFEEAGMRVEHAASREAALRMARRTHPDVVVLDRQLPDGDGWKAVDDLRRQAGSQDLIVIAITSHVALTNAERALIAGCEAFVQKPCDPEIVVAQAQRLLAARGPSTSVRARKLRDT